MGHLYAKLIDSPLPGILLDPEEPWMTPSSPIWHTQFWLYKWIALAHHNHPCVLPPARTDEAIMQCMMFLSQVSIVRIKN